MRLVALALHGGRQALFSRSEQSFGSSVGEQNAAPGLRPRQDPALRVTARIITSGHEVLDLDADRGDPQLHVGRVRPVDGILGDGALHEALPAACIAR